VAMSLVAMLAATFGVKQLAQDGISWLPAAAVVAGLAVGVLFVRRQLTLADPMIDVRLFRNRSFNAALTTNLVGILIAAGYFVFVAQYFQLVLGLSPLQAGLWSLPSAAGFVVGSNVAPRVLRGVRPAVVIGTGLLMGAVGLVMLTQVGSGSQGADLAILAGASVVVSLGLAPVFTSTTELIVGTAPPEKAGAASGISETGAELGGALGIATLGSIGVAVYRGDLAANLPAGIPAQAAEVAQETLGSAMSVAGNLPGALGTELLTTAQDAFTHGMHLTAGISAAVAVVVAALAAAMLRHVRPADGAADTDATDETTLTIPTEEPEAAPIAA
jgi:DHA2 family multidrug resistance protein-like MFS transporter